KRSGRNPLFLASSWMQPLDDFLEDMAPKEVYGKTWLAVHSNAEVFTDATLYPTYARWLERADVPAVVEVMHHNFEAGFPFHPPPPPRGGGRGSPRREHWPGGAASSSVARPGALTRPGGA